MALGFPITLFITGGVAAARRPGAADSRRLFLGAGILVFVLACAVEMGLSAPPGGY